MKILFIHLSDIHCRDFELANEEKTNALISTLNLYSNSNCIDRIVVICSGDLTNSGKSNEFKAIRNFFGKILYTIGEKHKMFINLFVVPGNHDLYYKNEQLPTAEAISKLLYSDDVNDNFESYSNKLVYFYSYARSKNSFINDKWIDNEFLELKDDNGKIIKFQINLVNTAPFSTSRQDNKESHYLPESSLIKLCKGKDIDYNITVMHHGTEWFCFETKPNLEKILYQNCEIIFQGHEHNIGAIKKTDENENNLIIIKGGEYSGQFEKNSSYSVLLLDTDTDKLIETIFVWDKDSHVFVHKHPINRIINKKLPIEKLYPNKSFTDNLFKDTEGISESFLSYFTFPQVEGKNNTEKLKINNSNDFFDLFGEHRIINLKGKRRSGKSATLKSLYYDSLTRNFCSLYLYKDNYQSKISTIVESLFTEQYTKNETDYNKFEYLDINNKIIFIDDFDSFAPRYQKQLLQHFLKHFGYIVFTSKENISLDLTELTKESLLSELNDEYEIFPLLICDFYKEKRQELIQKVLSTKSEYRKSDINGLVATIDYLVKKKYSLFELNPEFIIQYVKYFINKQNDDKTDVVFNIVFETNIRNLIIQNSSKESIEDNITLLEEIAYNIHFNYCSEIITLENLKDVAEQCRLQRGLNINLQDFIESMKSGLILKESSNEFSYEFVNINYLAYFVAKKVNKLIEKSGYEIPELKTILEYICFGINDNIILFLLYLRSNTYFTLNLCKTINEILTDIEELDFDSNNIPFLKKLSSDDVKAPNDKDKTQANKEQNEREKLSRNEQNEDIYANKIYDYPDDIDKMTYKIPRAMKYIEIVAKSFVSQFNDYLMDEKNAILKTIYSAPNKILFYILKPYRDNYQELINDFREFIKEIGASDKFTDELIEDFINKSANDLCLNVYNNFAFVSSTKKTLEFINHFPLDNSNYRIYNLIFEENGGTTESFMEKAIELFDNNEDPYINYLIRRIAFKHVLTNENISHNLIDRINEKLFNKSSKTQLLISANDKRHKKS